MEFSYGSQILDGNLWETTYAGSETLQVQRCLMNAKHRCSRAFVYGAREKMCVQGKAEYNILLLFNYTQLLSPLLVESHQSCMHTHTHTPHTE